MRKFISLQAPARPVTTTLKGTRRFLAPRVGITPCNKVTHRLRVHAQSGPEPLLSHSVTNQRHPLPRVSTRHTPALWCYTQMFSMNARQSFVCILHELKKQPTYEFKELENAATPYSTVSLNGTGYGTSKKQAKSEAARETLEILIPEMKVRVI